MLERYYKKERNDIHEWIILQLFFRTEIEIGKTELRKNQNPALRQGRRIQARCKGLSKIHGEFLQKRQELELERELGF